MAAAASDKQVVFLLVIAIFGAATSQDACQTPNRREGRCVPRTSCRSFNEYFSADRILNENELNFLRLSVCNEVPPRICCPDRVIAGLTESPLDATTTTTTTTTTRRPPGESLLPNPAKFECGLDILADRIFGGQDTSIEEFPWYALLEYITKKGERIFDCGGSLINRRYVLTAAHCLDNTRLDDGQQFVNVRLGDHNTATEDDCEDDGPDRFCALPPQNIGIEEIITHPGYSKSDGNQHNDIALIRLARDAEFNKFVEPICLPPAAFSPTGAGRNVTITGFGHTGRQRHSGVKQKAFVPIVDQAACRDKWNRLTVADSQLCAGGHFNIDSCSGDSGGPLMTQRLYWTIEGIVSFGNRCGLEGWPGVYTRVASYVDWIRSVIRP